MSEIQAVTTSRKIDQSILFLRNERVMLDADLAKLYGVETRVLVQAVKRNLERFPEDFMFQLCAEEFRDLREQAIAAPTWGGRRHPPYAFTEQGVAMLSGVLRSKTAISANIEIMRAFVRLRRFLQSHDELANQLVNMEKNYDAKFKVVFQAIRELMTPTEPARRQIGFQAGEAD
ncbi:MAG: ORF6N domain-containing protein [Acidobacteriota bacterium]